MRKRLNNLKIGATLLTVVVGLGVSGCQSGARMGAGAAYPVAKTQSGSVDAQVMRDEDRLTIINTSARPFRETTLWLNAQYGRVVPALDVGRTITLDLSSFKNEFGESFRAGGFFATERPDAIVLAQVELEAELVGLVVVRGKP
ncbi:MAG: hypothetical protein ACKVZJ_10060 [Phycisphaerales bacterium]